MSTVEQLLIPISAEAPCGADMQFAAELDAIARAREADDPSLEQGAWVTTVKQADWKFVGAQCDQLIATRSKDLKLAVWLVEARARTDGLRGFGEGLQLVSGLCDRYWDSLFPLADDGDHDLRIGKLRWLATCAPNLIRQMALTEGAGYSMIDFEAARNRSADAGAANGTAHGAENAPVSDLENARKRSSRGFYRQLLQDAGFCRAAILDVERAIDAHLGDDGPGFSAARATLDDLIYSVTLSAREVGAVPEGDDSGALAVPVVVREEGGAMLLAPVLAPVLGQASGPLQTRLQALAQLREVAAFFRHTEPHSPVAYLAEKAALWGEQPLHVWLRSVVKDEALCTQLDEVLGVGAA